MGLSIWLVLPEGEPAPYDISLFDNDITHNLAPMWRKAGAYEALYSEHDRAGEIIGILQGGLQDMKCHPDEYKALNPANGWGDYEGAIGFLEAVLEACKAAPNARVGIWA